MVPDSLSPLEARKLVLLSQRVPPRKVPGSAIGATQSAIEHLGYVQIDTISVVQRAHHHTLWARNERYAPSHLDDLVAAKQVFEYWSHAAAYLPMRDYRHSFPRKEALATGARAHWYEPDLKMMKAVGERIAAEGPLLARDFEGAGRTAGAWRRKPAKQALECLFMQGDLMICRRDNFHKVYELTERVLPEGVDTSRPTEDEHARFLIRRYLKANGLGQPAEIAYLRNGLKPRIAAAAREMLAAGELRELRVGDLRYYTLSGSLDLLGQPLARRRLKILSPFDNLVIQRKRLQALFGFDYLIECYLPEARRRYGYFVLPILWDGRLVARIDCKAERKTATLHVHHLALESALSPRDREGFFAALRKELAGFLRFNDCERLRLRRTSPRELAPAARAALDGLSN